MRRILGAPSFGVGNRMAWIKDAILKLVLILLGEKYHPNFCSSSFDLYVITIHQCAGITVYNSLWTMNWSRKELETPNELVTYSKTAPDRVKLTDIARELKETKMKLRMLEDKYKSISDHGVKTFPDVKYQNYHNKKRILVRSSPLYCNGGTYSQFRTNAWCCRSPAVEASSDLTWWTVSWWKVTK